MFFRLFELTVSYIINL